jgi:hypothetical protein
VASHPPLGLDAETKTLAASERNEEARSAWRAAPGVQRLACSAWRAAPGVQSQPSSTQLDPQQFVFVDESGTNLSLTRLYGWAPHDHRATGTAPRNHGKNTTLVAALAPDGLHEPWLIG